MLLDVNCLLSSTVEVLSIEVEDKTILIEIIVMKMDLELFA